MAQNYQVITAADALKLEIEHSPIFIKQLAFNHALIYRLPDGKLLVSPANSEEKYALIVENEAVVDEMLKNRYFPVPDSEVPFEKERDRIHNISQDISYYTRILSDKLQIDIEVKDDSTYFKVLTKALQKYTKEEIMSDQDFAIALGIYMGEIFRRRIGGIWAFRKVYILKPFWVPEISMHDIGANRHLGDYVIWGQMAEYMRRRGKFDLQKCLEHMGARHLPCTEEAIISIKAQKAKRWDYPE